jgi:hypothetical protein
MLAVWELSLDLMIGTEVGPYEIISAIGSSGMKKVYRAKDQMLERDIIGNLTESGAVKCVGCGDAGSLTY